MGLFPLQDLYYKLIEKSFEKFFEATRLLKGGVYEKRYYRDHSSHSVIVISSLVTDILVS